MSVEELYTLNGDMFTFASFLMLALALIVGLLLFLIFVLAIGRW